MPEGGISDEELLRRLAAVYSDAFVAEVTQELTEARKVGKSALVAEIHARFTYRMHNLSEFMKTLLQRALYSLGAIGCVFQRSAADPILPSYRLQVHGLPQQAIEEQTAKG